MKKRRKITRYKNKGSVPGSAKFSGKRYRLYQIRETAKSGNEKIKRLRNQGYSARIKKFKLTGSEKMYYAVYKAGSKK